MAPPRKGDPLMSTDIHPVDQMLPAPRLLALGLQHVLVMYAGAVAVPLIIGRALKLPPEDAAFPISADLFACGLATLVQCIGFPGVVMIESLGMFLALGEITGKTIDRDALTRGLRADGIGTLLGGIFNTFPYTSFSQNVGLVSVTGVRSRWVTVAGGCIMLLLGLLPKMAALVEAVPLVVLGGAGLVMFGMVAATGARILTAVDFRNNRFNLFVVAISVGFGMIPLAAPNFFRNLPHDLQPLLESGILLCALVAVMQNAFFNGVGTAASAEADAATTAASAQHV
jgi:uric acid transporter